MDDRIKCGHDGSDRVITWIVKINPHLYKIKKLNPHEFVRGYIPIIEVQRMALFVKRGEQEFGFDKFRKSQDR